MILHLALFIQYDRRMDGQMDRRTDGRTHEDSMCHGSIASHGKTLSTLPVYPLLLCGLC